MLLPRTHSGCPWINLSAAYYVTAGKLGSAGLDVFEREPQVPAELIAMDQVVLHPHQGSATHSTRAAMGKLTLDNVAAYVAGKPLLTPV